MSRAQPAAARRKRTSTRKILDEFESVEFAEKSRRIRVDFAQKARLIANDSFKALC